LAAVRTPMTVLDPEPSWRGRLARGIAEVHRLEDLATQGPPVLQARRPLAVLRLDLAVAELALACHAPVLPCRLDDWLYVGEEVAPRGTPEELLERIRAGLPQP